MSPKRRPPKTEPAPAHGLTQADAAAAGLVVLALALFGLAAAFEFIDYMTQVIWWPIPSCTAV